jgi:hypothetical protein
MKCLLAIVLFSSFSLAQVKQESESPLPKDTLRKPYTRLNQQHSRVLAIFQNIEHGLQMCTVETFDREFGTMVSIAIGSGERGYFSMNQAASVLTEYFSAHRPISFEFSHIYEKGNAPYATGRLVYVHKGNQGSIQVYVSLTRQDSRWVINQFNIY